MTMLSPREIAAVLKVGYDSALAFIKFSGIDYIRIGRRYRVDADKLQRFLAQAGQRDVDLTGLDRE